jgi:hypothetical protein
MRRIYVLKAVVEAGGAAPIVVDEGPGRSFCAAEVSILGPSRVVHRPEHPAGSPRVWIETAAALTLLTSQGEALQLDEQPQEGTSEP